MDITILLSKTRCFVVFTTFNVTVGVKKERCKKSVDSLLVNFMQKQLKDDYELNTDFLV